MATEPKTASTSPDRTLIARYGEKIVSRSIGTIPSLIFRWQKELRLTDADVVTIGTILSYYSTPPNWPSVSITAMHEWRGIPRERIEDSIRHLRCLGYLTIPGRDPKHGNSFIYDLSPLLEKLAAFAAIEEKEHVAREYVRSIRREAIAALSTREEPNRGQNRAREEEQVTEEGKSRTPTESSRREEVESSQ